MGIFTERATRARHTYVCRLSIALPADMGNGIGGPGDLQGDEQVSDKRQSRVNH